MLYSFMGKSSLYTSVKAQSTIRLTLNMPADFAFLQVYKLKPPGPQPLPALVRMLQHPHKQLGTINIVYHTSFIVPLMYKLPIWELFSTLLLSNNAGAFDVLKIIDSIGFELFGGIFVADNYTMLVHL